MPDRPNPPRRAGIEMRDDAKASSISLSDRSDLAVDVSESSAATGATAIWCRDKVPPFLFRDAQLVDEGKKTTADALAIEEQIVLRTPPSDEDVIARVREFLDALYLEEQESKQLQRPSNMTTYVRWRDTLKEIEKAATGASQRLVKLLRDERTASARQALFARIDEYAQADLDEDEAAGVINENEYHELVRLARRHGQDAAGLDRFLDAYQSERALKLTIHKEGGGRRTKRAGWLAPVWYKGKGEGAWDIDKLRDWMLDDFRGALDVANKDPESVLSLAGYLAGCDRDASGEALEARKRAHDIGCKELAVWHFLWATGYRELHLGKGHLPSGRGIATASDLVDLASREYVLDDLSVPLDDGLLESWLGCPAVGLQDAARVANEWQRQARRATTQERSTVLRHGVIRVLWALGLRGLPLWVGRRVVVVETVEQLHANAVDNWSSLSWSLASGVLAEWLDQVNPTLAGKARDSARGSNPRGLDLWSVLWSAGARELRFGSERTGEPRPGDTVVRNLDELVLVMERTGGAKETIAGLEFLLENRFLESWLELAVRDTRRGELTRAIRLDDRKLKLVRWLQLAGARTYIIGQRRIATVEDLIELPLHTNDLTELWEHIREGAPQQRFASDARVVKILDAVRDSTEFSNSAKPLLACLRLGLRVLPIAGTTRNTLETLDDLESVLLEPNGREALRGLHDSRVLETWVEAIAPGQGAAIASARWLHPSISVDRAVRAVLGSAVYPIAGLKASDYAELSQQVLALSRAICGDLGARNRIRDAIFGPIVLAGAPQGLENPDEDDLATINADHRPNVFTWLALGIPLLHLGDLAVCSLEAYLAAIANPVPRAEAQKLAVAGLLSFWYQRGLGRSLSPALRGAVPASAFPALCLEMGEPPPPVTVGWSSQSAVVAEGGTVTFDLGVANRDPVRATVLGLSGIARPSRGSLTVAHSIALAPGEHATTQIAYECERGTSGRTELLIELRYAAPLPIFLGEINRLEVTTGFPWREVIHTTLAWLFVVPAALLLVRLGLHPLLYAVLYQGDAFRRAPLEPSVLAALGVGAGILVVATEILVARANNQRFWSRAVSSERAGMVGTAAAIVAVIAFIHGYRGLNAGMLSVYVLLGFVLFKLAPKDLIAGALLGASLLFSQSMGALLAIVFGGLDTSAIMAASVFHASGTPGTVAIIGWGICGAFLGLAFGMAIALRRVSRPFEGEIARVGVLVGASILIGMLGG